MLGLPKYKRGDIVFFKFFDKEVKGVVEIVDAYGTFEDDTDASYDIYVEDENTLYKHIRERSVYQKS